VSVRSRIADAPVAAAKAFGGSVPPQIAAAEAASQMTPASPFGPGEPVGPYDGYGRTPRSREYVTGYNIATRPRTHEAVAFETLKGLIRSYDVAQICIRHRIASIRSLDWKLIAAAPFDGDVTDAIPVGLAALKRPDRKTLFKPWLAKYLRDVLSYDAGTLFRMRNRAGRVVGLKVVDGTMIAPLLDYWGDSPDAPEGEPKPEAYVQYVNGLPWNWLTRGDLIYEPYDPQSDSIYGRAPLEDILLNANTDIRFQLYFLQRFTEGNLPAAFASSPDSWSPTQIEQFQEYWDGFMLGDQSRKAQIRWMPPGSKFAWSNEKDFTDTFSLFLMRKTCAAFSVVPADLGFTESVNRSSGESQADVQHRVGDLPLAHHIQDILTAFLQDDLGLPLQFTFDLGEEQDDRVDQAQADKIYVDMGAIGASDIREMRYGLPEPEGVPVPRYIFTERAGPIPLSSLYAVAGQIDPATAAPMPGVPLPQKVFGGTEGVLPNPPIKVMSLAEQEFGPAAMPAAPPPQPQDPGPEPVAKDGEGGAPPAGITSDTGIYGYDGPGDDDDRKAPVATAGQITVAAGPEDAARKAVSKEIAAFRRFERARRKGGEWRDFRFEATGPVRAHRLNDAGRLAVRKAAGEIAVAGLAVQAQDTGRVLMLQRALCDDDPAAGTWEFPGGHMEGDEKPVAAAAREWSEETGSILPFIPESAAPLAFGNGSGWTSGIYAGFVYPVPSEDCVPVRSDSQVTNPDDPDGDQVEAIAWWDPAQLPGNVAVRPELLADIDAVMAALGCPIPAELGIGQDADLLEPADAQVAVPTEAGSAVAAVAKAYEPGQSFGDHAFRPTAGMPGVCHYCGMADSDPNHRSYPASVAKAGDADPKARREWPGWRLADKVTDRWAPELTAAAAGALTRDRLDRCARDYLAAFPGQDGNADGKRDRNHAAYAWLTSQGVTVGTGVIAAGVITDSYMVGAVSAAAMVDGTPADTGGWKPGDTSKATARIEALGAGAALAAVLAAQGASTADSLTGGILADLARALAAADGEMDAADLGALLSNIITEGDYAAGLVFTEICTYTGIGATDYYFQNTKTRDPFQWVTDPTLANCVICLTNEAGDPRPLGEPWPSGNSMVGIHFKCGCALIPG
jgi:8-oxo-dGTP pyrophosphatase MutT (NUDIX family)